MKGESQLAHVMSDKIRIQALSINYMIFPSEFSLAFPWSEIQIIYGDIGINWAVGQFRKDIRPPGRTSSIKLSVN